MSKVNLTFANLLVLICIFWLSSSHLSADVCPKGDCPRSFSTITGDAKCNPDWKPKWESSNSQQLSPGQSVTLNFGEGNRPYTVTVTGNDFWLDQSHTVTTIEKNYTGTITLYAGSNACGSAHIQVTDKCENTAVESVLSTVGRWGSWSVGVEEIYCDHWGYSNQNQEICDNPAYEMKWLVGGAGTNDPCPKGCVTFCSTNCCKTFCTFLGAPRYSRTSIKEREWVCP